MTALILVMFVLVWLELTQHLSCYGVCYCELPLCNEHKHLDGVDLTVAIFLNLPVWYPNWCCSLRRGDLCTMLFVLLGTQVKCMQCQHESNRYESMMDLAVEIHGIVESLEDALAQFTAPELLDGENKYKCDRYVLTYFPADFNCFLQVTICDSSLYQRDLTIEVCSPLQLMAASTGWNSDLDKLFEIPLVVLSNICINTFQFGLLCFRCNAYVKADKRLTLHEAPNVLTIALKRFQVCLTS